MSRKQTTEELEHDALVLLLMIGYAVSLGVDHMRDQYVSEYLDRFGARIPSTVKREEHHGAIAAIREAAR